jgi:hypothetical protein
LLAVTFVNIGLRFVDIKLFGPVQVHPAERFGSGPKLTVFVSQTAAVLADDHAPVPICTYCVTMGNGFIVIVTGAEVVLQPLAFVTSTVYAPANVAVYVAAVPTCVVPLNHL